MKLNIDQLRVVILEKFPSLRPERGKGRWSFWVGDERIARIKQNSPNGPIYLKLARSKQEIIVTDEEQVFRLIRREL